MPDNILAVRLGLEQNMGGGIVDPGLRALLAVTFILADIQTTTFYGNNLYMIWYDVGQLDTFQAFSFFAKQYYNRKFSWAQLSAPPQNPLLQTSRIYLTPQPPPPPPVAEGVMTLLDSGYDPLKGYWVRFEGNYDLTCPIFRRFENVNRNIPNYQIRQN